MRVVMISTDRKLFEEGSAVRARSKKYADALGELTIIVFAKEYFHFTEVSDGALRIIPTNSRSRIGYLFNAIAIGKTLSADVVSAQDPFETGFVGARIAKALNAKLQIQIHTDFLSPAFVALSPLNRLRIAIAGYVLQRADCIRVVSKRIADSLLRYKLTCPVSVLPIFVDVERIKNAPPSNMLRERYPKCKRVIVMASRLEPEKDIERAIRVFARLVENRDDIGLVIVGEGSEKERLKAMAEGYGISHQVVFEPWVEDLAPYYKSADLFLVTSKFEGYGMSIVEALAAGTPVLSSDVGVAGEAGAELYKTDEEMKEKIEAMLRENAIGELQNYPYTSEREYVERYLTLLTQCA